ncbi:hypothetical protein BC351_05480 [Paenibacillus ferrarius]|uniref:ABC transporter substrate-binding protein n=1 Tax=Paenibacillus ferrarius TaxID=1469647 RepID=A0A1V4HGL5_9BACL|nr:extracellular solute-binding protein [Paenibacillus ferrarius]OPH53327.1 hypothetical protein BC351_05480 [Paenibacillus ferrarius]
MKLYKCMVSLLVLIVCFQAGCSSSDTQSKHSGELHIGYLNLGEEDYYRTQYVELFESKFPSIKIELIPLLTKDMLEGPNKNPLDVITNVLTKNNSVDVILLDSNFFPALVNKNLFLAMDSFINRDKFDISGIVPTVINGIKRLGNNQIYALSPTFQSTALIYNKKIFSDAHIPFPKDNMTWEEIFSLASQLAIHDGQHERFGFTFNMKGSNNLFYSSIYNYMSPLNLRIFDENGSHMTVNTEAWLKTWSVILSLCKNKVIPPPATNISATTENLFESQKVAMSISSYNELTEFMKSVENNKEFEWDVVTVPSHNEEPGVGGSLALSTMMAINSSAINTENAWQFIKLINGDEWASLKSKNTNKLVSRKKYISTKETYNIDAFFKMTPPSNPFNDRIVFENRDIGATFEIGREKMDEVFLSNKPLKDALEEWSNEGNILLRSNK